MTRTEVELNLKFVEAFKNDEEKAEEYIINKYKLNKCYIVDTEETRVYMHNDVHSEYEEEYQIYLDGLAEGRKEICKKILEEVYHLNDSKMTTYHWRAGQIKIEDLVNLIKDLGVEI